VIEAVLEMFSSTASGFTDTPVTRVLIYFTVIVPILVAILEVQYLFDLSISPHLLEWRMLLTVNCLV
jgi:hypothetical protein